MSTENPFSQSNNQKENPSSNQNGEITENIIPPQYRGMSSDIVEELWGVKEYADPEKTKQEKLRKEAALIFLREKEKQKNPAPQEQEQRQQQEKNIEIQIKSEYKDLPNIQEGYNALLQKLNLPNQSWDAMKQLIYDMITERSEYVKLKKEVQGDLTLLRERFKNEIYEYQKEILKFNTPPEKMDEETKEFLKTFEWESNPAWFGIETRPEAGKREEINYKVYATIPMEELGAVQNIKDLAVELRKLALESDDIIAVKIANSFMGHLRRNDSIVVHFKNKENADKIQIILKTWMIRHNIKEEPREMNRIKVSADSKEKGASFSDLVAKNISEWLKQNYGKYDNNLLAILAVNYAIKQSQTAPKIAKNS